MTRILDFADGYSSATAPTITGVPTTADQVTFDPTGTDFVSTELQALGEEVDDRFVVVEGDITTIETDIGTLDGRVDALENLGPMSYRGTWNATSNTPTLASGVGTKGYAYRVSTAGTTNLDGISSWAVGDFAVYNGTAWDKWDTTDLVTSVNGATGAVVLTTTEISEGTNLYHTTSRARTAAVVNSTAGSETDQAASVAAMKTYVAANAGGTPSVASKTANYTAQSTDTIILCDASSGSFTISLPTASGITGKEYIIQRTDNTLANSVTIDPNSTETIDGATTRKAMTQGETWQIISDGTNWTVISHKCDTSWRSYTMTGSWVSNTTYAAVWRRVADNIEVQFRITATGTPTSANLNFVIPSGLAFDSTNKMPGANSTISPLGQCTILDSGTALYGGIVHYVNTTTVGAAAIYNPSGAANYILHGQNVSETRPMTWANGDYIDGFFAGPVLDWSA